MSHQEELEKKKYRNWVRGGLAYKYLKDGIKGFADDVVREEHRRINEDVISGRSCNQCYLRYLRPLHTCKKDHTGRNKCPWGQNSCNCLYTRKQRCPNNVCGAIMEEILKNHRSTPPSPNWKNTDIQKWCSAPWEIAKCFINGVGYSDKSKADDIDISGLLHVFINNIRHESHLSDKINNGDILSKILQRRNELFHSPNMELEDTKLNVCIDEIIAVLEDEKELKARQDAQAAVLKLKQLKQETFITITYNEAEVCSDALTFITNKAEELKQTIENAKDDIAKKQAEAAGELKQTIEDAKDVIAKKQTEATEAVGDKTKKVLRDALGDSDNKNVTLYERVGQLDQTHTLLESDIDKLNIIRHNYRKQLSYVEEKQVPEAIAEDPYYLNLYKKAIAHGKEIDSRIRVNIVGNFFQGKSSLARQLTGQGIQDIESTNTLQIYTCTASKSSGCFKLDVNKAENKDFAQRLAHASHLGREREEENRSYDIKPLYTASEVAPKVTKPTIAIKELKTDELSATQQSLSSAPAHEAICQIEATKPDDVPKEELEIFKQEVEKKLNDATADDNTFNVDIWDFGGQYLYYATHSLFHSRDAIYLLVFNLTSSLSEKLVDNEYPEEICDRTMEYFAKFWIQSIHSFVGSKDGGKPPVILVGTHKDKLVGDAKAKEEYADKYFSNIRELFKDTPLLLKHIQPYDAPVDNTDPTDVKFANLCEEISRLGSITSKAKSIPCRWIPLEKALQNERHRKFVTLDTVMEIDASLEFSLKDEEQIKLFLFYHHAKGTLFYFDDGKLSESIMLDPQYLIDAFKSILTSDRYRTKDSDIIPLWRLLKTDGRLEKQLLEGVWQRNGEPKFIEYKEVLVEFLKRQNIISEASIFDENSRTSKGLGWYIVPSMLKDHFSSPCLDNFLGNRKQTLLRYVIHFQHVALVKLVFHRLLAAMVGKWACVNIANSDTRLLFENLGVFRLNHSQAGLVEATDESIDLRLVSLNIPLNTDRVEADRFRRFSESIIEYEFRKLKRHDEHFEILPYKVCYRCNHIAHGLTGSKIVVEIKELDGKQFVPCPDQMNHDCIAVDHAKRQWILDDKNICFPSCRTPVSEKQLSKIAEAVGKNWQFLRHELDISQDEIERISMDYNTTILKIYHMLLLWKAKNNLATLGYLLRLMHKVHAVSINWAKIRNLIEDIDIQQQEARCKSGDCTEDIHQDDDQNDFEIEAQERHNMNGRLICESCEEYTPRYKIKPCGHFLCEDCIPRKKQKKKTCAACANGVSEVLEIKSN